ncbi:hypothetical protein AYO38_05320 [bacterium SCGC AG-212-C10]|nr:hypothetical protein AYO38_05320 [bacterium SCGC AG-212-C10]
MSVILLVSASEEDTQRLLEHGPRRDFLEIAAAINGSVRYRGEGARKGIRGKLFGPHIRQAWAQAGVTQPGDVIFADGEHIGLPLAIMLRLRRKRPAKVVMLGHLVSRRWKLALLWLATRMVRRGTLVLHSVEQQRLARRWVNRRWRIALIPYQVDTEFWQAPSTAASDRGDAPLVLAVGAENRDYDTLLESVRELPVRLIVAGGSHWARKDIATATDIPRNVTILTEPLGFAALRDLYAEASIVAVPLVDVPNQSGITVLLEAMSMARPVVVSATTGQRECVRGPLVTVDGEAGELGDRGPQHFGAPAGDDSGLYVPPEDPESMRTAIALLLADEPRVRAMGAAGRETVCRTFTTEAFSAAIAALLSPPPRRNAPAIEPDRQP